MCLGLRLLPDREGSRTAYFLGYNGVSSEGGRRLAHMVQGVLPAMLSIPDLGTDGMRIAMLQETRMPAVLIEVGPAWVAVEGAPKGSPHAPSVRRWPAGSMPPMSDTAPRPVRRSCEPVIHTVMHRLWMEACCSIGA